MSDTGGTSPPSTELDEYQAEATVAEKLNKLFATIRPEGGTEEYSNKKVAAAVGLTPPSLTYLRQGKRGAKVQTLRKLEKFFGAEPGYLDPDADPQIVGDVDRQLELIQWLRKNGLLEDFLQDCMMKIKTREAGTPLAS